MSNPEKKPRSYYVDYTKQRNSGGNRRPAGGSGTNNARFKEVPDFGDGGQRGFLITSVDEVKSYMEMRHTLEQYYHELYDNEGDRGDEKQDKKDISTEDELESELKHLRVTRPFKQIRTHCRNAIFLNIVNNFEHVDPVRMIDRFFDEMAEKRTNRTSNTFKVLPVLDTFRNNVASAKEAISKIFGQQFPVEEGPKKYFIEFQSRGNYKLESEDKQRMIEGVADTVSQLRPDWQRSKYNVIEFCKGFAVEP